MPVKKKGWYSNGNLTCIILSAVSAAVAAGTAAAIEGITRYRSNKSKNKKPKGGGEATE